MAAAAAAATVVAAAARVAEHAQCVRRCIVLARENQHSRYSGDGSEAGTFFSALTFGTLSERSRERKRDKEKKKEKLKKR